MSIYIFGFVSKGKFFPESLFESLEASVSSLEYWALSEEKYQIWEYPSGKIYEVSSNKKLKARDETSFPGPETWQPNFNHIKTDKAAVTELFEIIESNPMIVKRTSIRWLRPWQTVFFNINRRPVKKLLKKYRANGL